MLKGSPFRVLAAAGVLLLYALNANAQLIDNVDWHRQGDDAVLEVTFAVPIQFQRATIARSNDLAQVFYQLRPRGDLPSSLAADRRIAASEGLPAVSISDDPVLGLLDRKLLIRFDRKLQFSVRAGPGNCCVHVVVAGAGAAVDARNAVTVKEATEDRFLITLQQSTDPNLRMEVPVPSELQAYQLFTARRVVDGHTVYEINLGYFSTRAEAERALKVVVPRFPRAKVVEVASNPPPAAVAAVREPTPGPAPASPEAAAPAPVPTPPPAPIVPAVPVEPAVPGAAPSATPPPAPAQPSPAEAPAATVQVPAAAATAPATPGELDQKGRVLLAQARAAMDKGDLEHAIADLNQLLNLPPNIASQDGQELIGVARARIGDVHRARAEFELYLKLYPTGPGAERVHRELDKLAAGGPAPERRVRRIVTPVSTFNGSFAQYYFGGRSQITQLREGTPLQGVPVPATQDPISQQDQKQLQSSLDMNYRYRDGSNDVRVVFRDIFTKNFLKTSSFSTRSPNRLNAAYVEYSALPTGISAKVGRQSPTGDGVLYRFDGARLGYQFVPKFGVNVVAGVPTDDLFDAKRRFYGFSLDAQNLGDHFGGSLYAIQQTIDGETDRRAIGTELRYFDPNTNVFGVYDYDTLFRAVNIASLQGTVLAFNNSTTFNFLADRRTAPILTTGNALLVPDASGNIRRSITEYLQTLSIDEVRQLAKATTTYVKQGQVGVNVQTSPNLQFGVNTSVTNIGALPAFDPDPGRIPTIPAQPATGNIYSYGLQGIASNLYSERDSHVISLNLLKGATYTGKLIAYNNLSAIGQQLQFEPSLKYYRQDDTNGQQISRWTPGVRISWRVTNKISIEGDAEYETNTTRQPFDTTTGTTPVEKANRVFYFVGYRVDF
jgi:tetratricopeptide (TPR) repeat protein